MYDMDRNGYLDTSETSLMMIDLYRSMNKHFQPTRYEAQTLNRIMDKDNDGKVTYLDIQTLVNKYLVGDTQ